MEKHNFILLAAIVLEIFYFTPLVCMTPWNASLL